MGDGVSAEDRRAPDGDSEALFDALRADALKWREIAAKDGGGVDRKAEETLDLLAEIDRLRTESSRPCAECGHISWREESIVCPRCEGQEYDRGSCALCGNLGRLDSRGERLT